MTFPLGGLDPSQDPLHGLRRDERWGAVRPDSAPRPGTAAPSAGVLRRYAAQLEREALAVRRRAMEIEEALAAVRSCLAMLPDAPSDPGVSEDPPQDAGAEAGPAERSAHLAVARAAAAQGTRLPPLRVWMLGGFRVELGERRLPVRHTKVWSFIKFLAARDGGPVAAEVLADTFWRDATREGGLQSVYSAAHAARRALGGEANGEVLVCDGGFYSLAPGADLATDVAFFRERVAEAARLRTRGRDEEARRALRAALDAYRGPFLPEEVYERWAVEMREVLAAERLKALERLAALAKEAGDLDEAVDCHLRVVEADPLREESHRALIAIHLERGQRSQAVARYERLARLLRRELGMDVDPRTRALVAPVMDGGARG